ncbi:MAG: 50S ribosomal protein L9 [Arenimonas sp.]|jgi:large subunit ribosomal protein L9|nr:50S ribosomal protein L9 [Arenimonas sp.]
MKLILLQKVVNLGGLGDLVDVKPGYGRNFLVPFGKAVPATANNIATFEAKRAEYEAKADAVLATAQARKEKLEGASVTIAANASTEGKLFGSVGPRDVAEAFTAAGNKLDKSEVVMSEGALRRTGEYDIEVRLHADVHTTVKVVVEPEA